MRNGMIVGMSRSRWLRSAGLAVIVAGFGLGSCRADRHAEPVDPGPAGWSSYGGDPGGNRYSPAAQIDAENVGTLREAWRYSTGDMERRPKGIANSGFEATPILVDDSLVFCSPFNEVIALDPATGKQKWRFDPRLRPDLQPASAFVCRGVSAWHDRRDRSPGAVCRTRILTGTLDGRVIALDARTGKPCRDFGNGGEVRVDPGRPLEWQGEFGINSAPAIIGDTVIVGTAISDNRRVQAPLGTVRAYDVRTGAERWTYDPVPQRTSDPAAGSWPEKLPGAGHGNVWSTISVDAARGLVFLPTSSPAVDFYGGDREGDNRDTSSIVAVRADTGKMVWSFQTVRHNLWDYDVAGQPGLYSIKVDGKLRDVVVSVTKTGIMFVLDRDTGEPIFPVVDRPVPQAGVPGEKPAATQPFAPKPGFLGRTALKPEDAFGLTPYDRAICRKKVASLRNEGIFTPPSLQGSLQLPFSGGGANWGSTAYHPDENVVIVNINNLAGSLTLRRREDRKQLEAEIPPGQEIYDMAGTPYIATRSLLMSPWGIPCSPPPWGELIAIDMATATVKWRRNLGSTRDIAPLGIARDWGVPNLGGPIVSAGGLVFIAATVDDYLRAFDIRTGRELWKGRLPAGGQATPMTYSWRGRQYVVVAAGGNARSRTRLGDEIIAFALP